MHNAEIASDPVHFSVCTVLYVLCRFFRGLKLYIIMNTIQERSALNLC